MNSSPINKPVKVFVSYAHEDRLFRDELINHLSPLRNNGMIECFHDGEILPGQEWSEKLCQELMDAKVILLLISSDFLASNFINKVELKTALDRHNRKEALVIPIIIRWCSWKNTSIAKLQILPEDAKPVKNNNQDRDEAWKNVVQKIEKSIETIVVSTDGIEEKEQSQQDMLPLEWETFSKELKKTLHEADKVWLFSRTGMGWWNSKIITKLTPFFNKPNDKKLRFLFLDPNSISFDLDTKYSWSPVLSQTVNFQNLAEKQEMRKSRAIEFYTDIMGSVSLKVIDILIPLSMWIIWPKGKQQPKLFVEIPTNRTQYERNLYLPIDASSGDTKQQRLCKQYCTLFNRLWNEARLWNP